MDEIFRRIPEYSVGWGTLALINAALAQANGRSSGSWFLLSLFLGPVATLFLVLANDSGKTFRLTPSTPAPAPAAPHPTAYPQQFPHPPHHAPAPPSPAPAPAAYAPRTPAPYAEPPLAPGDDRGW